MPAGIFLNAADPNSSKLGKKSNYKGYMAKATKLAKTSDGNYLYLVFTSRENRVDQRESDV